MNLLRILESGNGERKSPYLYTIPAKAFHLTLSRLFCDIVAGVVVAMAFHPETFSGDGKGGRGRRELDGSVYVSGFLCVMEMDKGGFIPL